MIDVKTLRLGSHYYNESYENKPMGRLIWMDGGVDNYDNMRVALLYDMPLDKDTDPYEAANVNYLQPIPITDSLLRKIGFVGDGPDVFIDHKSACIIREDTTQIPDVRICKCQDGLWGVAMQNSMFQCKYLHELENMYYHVFGKELVEG